MSREEELDLLADHVVGILDENCREAVRQAVGEISVMRICGICPQWVQPTRENFNQADSLLEDVLSHIAKRWGELREMERRLKASVVYQDGEEFD